MLTRKSLISSAARSAAIVAVAATALTGFAPVAANAGDKELSTAVPAGGVTDVSARRRIGPGGAAGAGVAAGIVGTGLAIAATQGRRGYYDNEGYYGSPYDAYGSYDGPGYGGGYYGNTPGSVGGYNTGAAGPRNW